MASRSGIFCLAFMLFLCEAACAEEYFEIIVLDEASGRGIPLVELRTVNGIQYVSDSAGRVAFSEPGLMDRDVFFYVRSHGYEFPADGFGIRGRKLRTTAGTSVTIELKRRNIAERLYRVTGEGIYRDSILLKRPVPIEHPVLNAGVLGSDSVLCATFQGKLHWFWGDTNIPGYPLGLFHTPGATSPLRGKLHASDGINLTYFMDENGQAVNTAQMPGTGPTWLSGLTVLRDLEGRERMFAGYAKIKPPLSVYERGIVEFNPSTSQFEQRVVLPAETPLYPDGQPCIVQENGMEYIYFARPFPDVRVPATIVDFLDVSRYESNTCFAPGTFAGSVQTDGVKINNVVIERGEDGHPLFAWKRGVPARDWQVEQKLLESGQLKESDLKFVLRNVEDGRRFIVHNSGSISWNHYRQCYVMIALEALGSSPLGEIWYAEADHLSGPWSAARKVVTHENYSFYNPMQHPEFAEDGGRFIYFEGTYTHTFTNNPERTPRYDYNQIMYRLDLADERLHLRERLTNLNE